MDGRLHGKTAIVVGAGSTPGETMGNGRATAILFAREGASVLLVDRVAASADETRSMIDAEGGRTREVAFETVLFISDLRDKIVWRPGLAAPSIQMWTPDNIARTWGRGIESSFTIRRSFGNASSLLGRGVHTFSRVEDRSDRETRSYAKQVRYVPQHVFKFLISAGSDRFGIDVIFSLTGKRFVTSDETQSLPANREITIRLRATESIATGSLSLVVAVENATDQSIESIRFYPMPPRHMRVSIVFESGH